MLDHLLRFPSRAAAGAALESLGLASQDEHGDWQFSGAVCLNIGGPNDESVRLVLGRAQHDANGNETSAEALHEPTKWHCIVRQDAITPALRDLPGSACRIITDTTAAHRGRAQFVKYMAADVSPAIFAAVKFIEPVLLGSDYQESP